MITKKIKSKAKLLTNEINKQANKLIKKTTDLIFDNNHDLLTSFPNNDLAKQNHHPERVMVLKEIITFNQDIKTFVFSPKSQAPLAFFNPGQYVRIYVKNDQICASRDYALSSSPQEAIEKNIYAITIKRVPNGTVSNFLLDHAKVNDEYRLSAPTGNFYYSSIRDHQHVVGIAGGSGITPFYSIAKALNDGTLNFKLTLFYGVNTLFEAVFAKELEQLQSKNFKLILVLGKEQNPKYEHGFVSRALVDKYVSQPYSLFVCGSNGLYAFIFKEFKDFPLKDRRMEPNPMAVRKVCEPKTFNLTIRVQDEVYNIKANNEETILMAIEKAGIKAPSRCKSGSCGFCRAQLLKGCVCNCVDKRRYADQDVGAIHVCCVYPDSDLEIKINHNF